MVHVVWNGNAGMDERKGVNVEFLCVVRGERAVVRVCVDRWDIFNVGHGRIVRGTQCRGVLSMVEKGAQQGIRY